MEILLIIILFLLVILLLFFVFVFVLFCWSLVTTRAPFIPVPNEVLPDIIKALELKDNSVVYDLGCGDARVLQSCFTFQPKARCVGIEKDLIPYWIAKRRLRQKQNTAIKIIRQNFFKHNLSEATHIFLYLFPELMNDLLPKLKAELKPGTRLVSCSFSFKDKEPVGRIDLNRSKGMLARELYIYEF